MILSYEQALLTVKERVGAAPRQLTVETAPLEQALGRVLAEDVTADRDYPPFHRSARDGYAIRSQDLGSVPVTLECAGEIAAGSQFHGTIGTGQCAAIMTGAPLPEGSDAVVMIEQTAAQGSRVEIRQAVQSFENVVHKGTEATAGSLVLPRRSRLGASELGLLAANGVTKAPVFRKPLVAILPTGNELVPAAASPQSFQIRDSNATALAAQVTATGAEPWQIGIAPDREEDLRALIRTGLEADLLLISGGVSVGKYDLVESVLEQLGAEFYFRGAAIRPGKPVVFGRVQDRFFFGLPGNPLSAFVTFELFVRPALAALAGAPFEEPLFLRARLIKARAGKEGLTVFSPARVRTLDREPIVDWVLSHGSGDLVSLAAANCFIVQHPGQPTPGAGEWVDILPKSS